MVKNLHYFLLFCTLHIASSPVFASSELLPLEDRNIPEALCDAPAPDSFRVTSRGPNSIDLAWNPSVLGATHTLNVLTKSSADEWIPFGTYSNISGASYTVNNLVFDADCRFIISTNCTSGEASKYQAFVDDKIIIDLILGGRIPINPVPLNYCDGIVLSQYNWVGFKVNFIEGTPVESNLFEFAITQTTSEPKKIGIKRVYDNTVIYATDDEGNWPPPAITSPNPFKIIRYFEEEASDIGRISVKLDYFPVTAHLCQSPDYAWNDLYDYTVYVANEVVGGPINNGKDRSESNRTDNVNNKIRVQSPFKETIKIFNNQPDQPRESVNIRLLDTNGLTVLERQVEAPFNQLSLPVGTISPGFYVLIFETNDLVQTLKVVKIN